MRIVTRITAGALLTATTALFLLVGAAQHAYADTAPSCVVSDLPGTPAALVGPGSGAVGPTINYTLTCTGFAPGQSFQEVDVLVAAGYANGAVADFCWPCGGPEGVQHADSSGTLQAPATSQVWVYPAASWGVSQNPPPGTFWAYDGDWNVVVSNGPASATTDPAPTVATTTTMPPTTTTDNPGRQVAVDGVSGAVDTARNTIVGGAGHALPVGVGVAGIGLGWAWVRSALRGGGG